jgi:hypothetical protein
VQEDPAVRFAAPCWPFAAFLLAGRQGTGLCSGVVSQRAYVLAALGAAGAAFLVAGQTYLSMLSHGHSWWRLLAWQLLTWTFWAALAPSIVAAGRRLQSESLERAPKLRLQVATALGVTLLHQILAAALTVWIQPLLPIERMGAVRAFWYLSLPWAFVDLLIYGLLVAFGWSSSATERRLALERRESMLEAELARAQLQALRLELQPHFLFNTLNSIAALVRKRSHSEALEMVLGLSHLLRLTLDRSDRPWVALDEELAFVRRYVELQRQRFADRLRVTYSVDPDCGSIEVPPLLLQPLVENAIRHGIADRPEGGTIEIHVWREHDDLHLRIADDGPGPPAGFRIVEQAGVGLGSTRSRLERLYGDRARIVLVPGTQRGAVAEIVLPAVPSPALVAAAGR